MIANFKDCSRKVNSNFEMKLHSWEQHLFVRSLIWLVVHLFVCLFLGSAKLLYALYGTPNDRTNERTNDRATVHAVAFKMHCMCDIKYDHCAYYSTEIENQTICSCWCWLKLERKLRNDSGVETFCNRSLVCAFVCIANTYVAWFGLWFTSSVVNDTLLKH